MRKPDDSSLSSLQYRMVRKEAEQLLSKAGAIGQYPTPVDDLLSAANLTLAPAEALNESFLKRFHKKCSEQLKRALSKVIGLFDATARLIFIDDSQHKAKQTFLKLHEVGHGTLPWQRDLYRGLEDCQETLDPEVADSFEKEANVFATEVLFQLDGFTNEAEQRPFELKTPLSLAKKYGASTYASIRQYVSKSQRQCVVIVLNAPELIPNDGFRASLRRVVASPTFATQFGELNLPDIFTPDDKIGAMIPIGGRRMTGRRNLALVDANGINHECLAEAFNSTFNVFILIYPVRALTKTIFLMPVART